MNHEQMQQEITIIKQMIEKTRKQSAESGHFFIFLGIAAAVFVLVISMLELFHQHRWVLPAMIILAIINGIIGFLVVKSTQKMEKVKTYSRDLVLSIWFICSSCLILITFLFPFLGVFQFHALPVLVSLFLGIAVFMTGVIYDLAYFRWLSGVWWLGAILMAVWDSEWRFLILIGSIIVGWILPGIILNRQYNKRSASHES